VTTSAKTITFTVNSKARSLGPSTYTDNIDFNDTTNNQGNTTRAATLTVNPKDYKLVVSASPSADGTARFPSNDVMPRNPTGPSAITCPLGRCVIRIACIIGSPRRRWPTAFQGW
jgi:hypothetical protein